MGQSYNINKKALVELTAITAATVTDTTAWFMEIGLVTDTNKESKIIPIDELALLIDTDTTATASNVGAGTGLIFKQKAGIDLEFKSLIAGANITINNNASDIEIIAAAGGGGTSIEDAATTTGLYTEETADRLVGHSANTGTDLIFEMFEGTGTPVSVFQIDGNGDLLNNGGAIIKFVDTSSLFVGTKSAHSGATQDSNVVVGFGSCPSITSGQRNSIVGMVAGASVVNGNYNCYFGNATANSNVSGARNTMIGYRSGFTGTGSNNVFIGSEAGYRQTTTSNKFIVNNYLIANEATELTDSLIVGDFNATVTSQTIQFNALTTIRNAATGNLFTINDASTDVYIVDDKGNTEQDGYEKSTGSIKAIDTITLGPQAITSDNYHILLDGNAGATTATLPAISATNDGTIYVFTCINSDNVVTLQVTGGDYIGYTGTVSSVLFSVGQMKNYQADNNSGRWMEIFA